MKTSMQGSLTAEEVTKIIKTHLSHKYEIVVDSISYQIAQESEPDDWRAEYGTISVFKGVSWTTKPTEHS